MNDRYLYRGKRIDNGEWVEGFYFCMTHPDGRHTHHFIIPLGADLSLGTPVEKIQVEVDPDTICQCTGYKGIYERDIFQCDDSIYVIAWSDDDLCWEALSVNSSESIALGEFAPEEIDIIGNEIDNPGRCRMERLTYKEGNHYYFANDCLVGISTIDEDSLNVLQNVLDKLGAYEDAEEQGLILRLPCKVGDKIFLDFAGFGKDIDEFTVKDFHLDCFEDGETILYCDYESNDKTLSGQIDVMEFGKTVFLTKEEAEAKLAEMEGGLKSVETGEIG